MMKFSKQIKFLIYRWKIFFVWYVALWDQFINFFDDLVSLFIGIIKILCGMWYYVDKMQNIMLYFSN